MSLEEDIKQKKFKNLYDKLAVNILYTHSWLFGKLSNFLKEYDLTVPQYNVLRILRGQYPKTATINLIKERMLDKMSDASRLVERLKQKGLLERTTCEKDRRRADIIITEKGLKKLEELDSLDGELKYFFNDVSKQELEQINNFLDKIRG
ncbi:MAG: MarR family transcriptional regulator [Ignavibacteria bacterium]|jgi:DNA-binding MarR family transcriptional regulator